MSTTTSSALTQEFTDMLSAQLLIAPDPAYVFAKLAMGARYGAMNLPDVIRKSGVAANMEEAMGGANGTLDMNPQFMRLAADFVKMVEEVGTGPGKVFLLDQPNYLTAGLMTEASRRLTEGTAVSATPQAVTMGQVPLTCREYAGPHDGSNVAPVAITDFLKRRSKHDLVEYLGVLLRRDRNAWLDLVLCNLLLSTSNVSNGSGAASLSTATAGSNPLIDDDLAAIKLALQSRNIPRFSDGFYCLVISPQHEADLRKDDQFREIVRYQAAAGPLTQGHLGDYNGFHILVSNNVPTAGVGSGGSVTGYQGVAFGPQAVGWGIGMEAEARRSKADDFGREDRLLWISHEAFALLNGDFVQKVITS
jgi:hypothetical protein